MTVHFITNTPIIRRMRKPTLGTPPAFSVAVVIPTGFHVADVFTIASPRVLIIRVFQPR